MDFEQLDEFYAVRETACDGLRAGSFVGDAGRPLCRFVVVPSFENSVAWDVRSMPVRGKLAEPRLFRSCWRTDVDLHALGSPVERLKYPRPYRPTVEVASAHINAAKIDELVRRFQRTPVPLGVAEPPSGCDGTNYQLEIGNFFCHARIGWWDRLPEEWAPLRPVKLLRMSAGSLARYTRTAALTAELAEKGAPAEIEDRAARHSVNARTGPGPHLGNDRRFSGRLPDALHRTDTFSADLARFFTAFDRHPSKTSSVNSHLSRA